tara:strand:+ start:38 stop:583 length:546 start_codon:yes stop_codon:yes gene_type:complete
MKKPSLILGSFLIIFILQIPILYSKETKKIEGIAEVIDGDTLKIIGKKIRLFGIDAPEVKQRCKKYSISYLCGEESKNILSVLVKDKIITCFYKNKDMYGRILGICRNKNIKLFDEKLFKAGDISTILKEINATMVLLGYAVSYKKYSKRYNVAEEIAKDGQIGLWIGEFEMPWEWRKKNK